MPALITFEDIFPRRKPLIACIHLQALPGAPLYRGYLKAVYDQAIAETELFAKAGVDALIVENFGDVPFYPDRVPSETVAAMAAAEMRHTRAQPTAPRGSTDPAGPARKCMSGCG